MDKIYTRHRMRIPVLKSSSRRMSNRTKMRFIISIVFIVIIVIFMIIIKATRPAFDNLCKEKAKSMATIISNEQATIVMKEYSYDNIFEIEKDVDGNVKMVKSNIFTINEITSDIAIKIQKELNNKEEENVKIPLGAFTGSRLLSGSGPNVKIKISTIGNVETDLKSEFIAQGINQTLHRVYLQVNCEAIVLTPFHNIESNITNQVLLVENVIVGNIPNTFYNFEGTNQESTALETVN